ncbi:MAG: class I SAM-dependent methyltransferase [Chloroflexi bacterium]|nr:class I SAM-dependent methyltransferase [Chloroflexota bacterium]
MKRRETPHDDRVGVGDALRPDPQAALAAWAARVRANREQVDRVREVGDGDFYAPVATSFRFGPARADDPLVGALAALVRSEDVVLDIGAGGGRYAVPLARVARQVIALDPSPAMLALLRAGIAETGLENIEVVEARWPVPGPSPKADVALIVSVAHDVEDIGGFLEAMERAARRLCIAVLLEVPPPYEIDALWSRVHGEPRATLPALPELLALQLARGRLCEVRLMERSSTAPAEPAAFLARARRMLWVREGSAKDQALQELLAEPRSPARAVRLGVVSWSAPS